MLVLSARLKGDSACALAKPLASTVGKTKRVRTKAMLSAERCDAAAACCCGMMCCSAACYDYDRDDALLGP